MILELVMDGYVRKSLPNKLDFASWAKQTFQSIGSFLTTMNAEGVDFTKGTEQTLVVVRDHRPNFTILSPEPEF